ncbi:putative Insulin-like growth factor-binding protein complex acid labile subunit [Hypsibius exemplaris]|uniref:Insulin-like growth factor-binding protein complex acid labile subunit n=1 Tax=Hypsibius exemplaris TaxID=2072580 RepID=A0A1W0WQS1_HYPEX|nr:putative Insulin-like growth factor-binding protein complex acid labile subunit [Hypsibius exemplaris]
METRWVPFGAIWRRGGYRLVLYGDAVGTVRCYVETRWVPFGAIWRRGGYRPVRANMKSPVFSFVFLLCLSVIRSSTADCPAKCACDRDVQNRKRIRCDTGGGLIRDGTFIPELIDRDTEVLYISAPPGQPNRINQLTPAMFQGLKLQELHILHSQLRSIGARTFFYLSNTLKVLNLAHNQLMDISENNFRNLSGLTHLHLDYNRIVHLHSATFNYQRNLRVLTLSNNRIYDLGTRFLLQEVPTLEVVDLSSNPLGAPNFEGLPELIPGLIFQDVPNLRRVSFANTSIDRLPYAAVARHCTRLEDLDVSHNKFTVIQPGQFNEIKSLRKLNLAGNRLSVIQPGALRGITLDYLDLSETLLPGFTDRIFEGAKVHGISIASNQLQSLDTAALLPIAKDLVRLDVGGNPLALTDRMFKFLPQLKGLSLASMRLASLPAKLFDYPHEIRSFNISSNIFRQLDQTVLESLPNLEVLDLSKNELQSLPFQLAQPTLTEFYVTNNALPKIPDHFTDVFRSASSKIKTFRVDGNPLECNWSIGGLADWISSPSGRSVVCGRDAGERCPVCAGPAELKGKSVDEIKVKVSTA